jgi:hypothetical protein
MSFAMSGPLNDSGGQLKQAVAFPHVMRGDIIMNLTAPASRRDAVSSRGRVIVDEVEARAEAAVRINNLIRRTGQQVQQLIQEYSCSPGATVGGLAFLCQQAVTTLEELCDLKRRLLSPDPPMNIVVRPVS